MQIEKHLYRISERVLRHEHTKLTAQIVLVLTTILALVTTMLLVVGHTVMLPNNRDLERCLQATQRQLLLDEIQVVTNEQLTLDQLEYYQKEGKIVADNEECSVIRDRNSSALNYYKFLFSYSRNVLSLSPQMRELLLFHNNTYVLKKTNALRSMIYGFSTLLINQLIGGKSSHFLNNTIYINTPYLSLSYHVSPQPTFISKCYTILKSTLFYAIISIMTALYIYATIIASPAFIVLIINCCRDVNLNEVYRIFPWVGIHSVVREASENPVIRRASLNISLSILFYFFNLYMIYYSTIFEVGNHLFQKAADGRIAQLMFGFIALIQFASMLFIRTRTFMKYFPVSHSILFVMLILYGQFCQFGFKVLAYFSVSNISLTLFVWMLVNLEIPAQTTWDRARPTVPTLTRPRIGLFPLFNLNWINNMADQWTLLLPLFGREYFTPQENSFADRNFAQLEQILPNPPVAAVPAVAPDMLD